MQFRSLLPSSGAAFGLTLGVSLAAIFGPGAVDQAWAQDRNGDCQPIELPSDFSPDGTNLHPPMQKTQDVYDHLTRRFRDETPILASVVPIQPVPVITRIRRPSPVQAFTPPPADPLPDFAPGELVVVNLGPEDLAALLDRGFVLVDETEIGTLNITVVLLRIPPGLSLTEARDLVRSLPTGAGADFNHFYRAVQAAPGSTERTLVGWPLIPTRDAACGGGMAIGMIDSGINENHPTFAGAQMEVLRLPHGAKDDSGQVHGTGVAALLVGDPDSRSPGLLPGARLIAVDAFYRAGTDERTDTFMLLEALGLLSERGVKIINLSLAGPDNTALGAIIGQLTLLQDIVVVAAVGNNGPDAEPAYPAAYEPVLAVTAVDLSGHIYDQAVRGPHVDLSAPGVNVWTAASVKGARWKTGTSFAAPFVTAAAAVLRLSHPELSVADVAIALRDGARDLGVPGPDSDFGAGLVNLGALCDTGL